MTKEIPFNPYDYCEKLYKTVEGKLVRYNASGACPMDQLNIWAQEHWDEIELLPGPSQEQLLSECIAKRKAAYTLESDPIFMEATRNSYVDGGPPDLQDWLDKVQEIKDRYPKP